MPNRPTWFTPIAFLRSAARRYCDATGAALPRVDYRRVAIDRRLGRSIAEAYLAAPRWDRRALPAYRAFRDETVRQYRFLLSLGVTVTVVDADPYESAAAMAAELSRGVLRVYSTRASRNPHPYLSDRENDMFRAVHDAFGHASTGAGFDGGGEEAAWLKHSHMYSPLARRALTTETRGQSCALFFHYRGERFAEQKLALLPPRYSDPGSVTLVR